MEDFFLICPPNFESIALWEIRQRYQDIEPSSITLHYGGIEIKSIPLSLGLSFNITLKSINRVLLRVERFSAKDFPKLFKKTSKLTWRKYLVSSDVTCHATSKMSRLIHSDRIASTVKEGIEKSLQAQAPKQEPPFCEQQEVYIHFYKDECTISIDTSGELLYKKNLFPIKNTAPIRESILSGMHLFIMKENEKWRNKTLIDPMCGSGAVLLSARDLNENHPRDFSFKKRKGFVFAPGKPIELPYSDFEGFDQDQELIVKVKKSTNLTLSQKDFYQLEIRKKENKILFFNPPYNLRLKTEVDAKENFKKIVDKVQSMNIPFYFIYPTSDALKGSKPILTTTHGGLKIGLYSNNSFR